MARVLKLRTYLIALGFIPILLLSAEISTPSTSSIHLKDRTQQSGISFTHTDGNSGKFFIVETVASGLATFDFNGDGLIDILFLNGANLTPNPKETTNSRNALYQNQGSFKFKDVTIQAGLTDNAYHLGVCTADYDNDGDLDIYLSNFGFNILYQNNGNGTFTDVTKRAGVGFGDHVGAGVCFLDIDGDGDLDLFAGSYVQFTLQANKSSVMNGFQTYVGPLQYPPTSNRLYKNNGNGTFTDISFESGIGLIKSSGMGVVAADIDNDGDTDIIIANDLRANSVFINDGKGKFTENAGLLGLAYDPYGNVQGNMGIDCADWNNDGWLDFYITTYHRQFSTLYQNHAGQFFDDVTRSTGAGLGTFPQVTWGTGLIDFNNDGFRDIYIACGHLIDSVEKFDSSTHYRAKNILLENNRRGNFINVSDSSGDGMSPEFSSRGAVFDDLDNDGDIDAVILNSRSIPTLLRNDSKNTNNWLQIRLIGSKTNRDGVGARAKITADGFTQIAEVHSGRSYQSDFGKRLHFGLGQRKKISELHVKWIGGTEDVLHSIPVNCQIVVTEGQTHFSVIPANK